MARVDVNLVVRNKYNPKGTNTLQMEQIIAYDVAAQAARNSAAALPTA
jgi:hypothetical protein